jgi:hypothetical protein
MWPWRRDLENHRNIPCVLEPSQKYQLLPPSWFLAIWEK